MATRGTRSDTGTGTDGGDSGDEQVRQLAQAVAALTELIGRLQSPQPAPQVDPATQRSSFGYGVLLGLMGRQAPGGGDFPVPFVGASRSGKQITFTFPPETPQGSHVELHAGPPPAGTGGAAASREVVPISGGKASTSFDEAREIDSVLILDGAEGPVVAIGPRLPATSASEPIE